MAMAIVGSVVGAVHFKSPATSSPASCCDSVGPLRAAYPGEYHYIGDIFRSTQVMPAPAQAVINASGGCYLRTNNYTNSVIINA